MASLEREHLIGHPSRSVVAGSGGCIIAFGLPFLLVGLFVMGMTSGLFTETPEGAPPAILVGVGALFAGAGLFMIVNGVRSSLTARRATNARAQNPGEPWIWDHRWNPQETRTGGFGPVISGTLGAGFFALFAAPFNWVGFHEGSVPFMIAAGILDLIVLVAVGAVLYQFAQWLRYGTSVLRFTTFPYYLGSSLDVVLPGSQRLRGCNSLTLTLRCVEESFETQGKSNSVQCYRIYEDVQTIPKGMEAGVEMGALPISFRLPDGDYETRLSTRPPRYWELMVKADKPGLDFNVTFLLPVYGRPGSAAARAADDRDASGGSPPPSRSSSSKPRGNLKPTAR